MFGSVQFSHEGGKLFLNLFVCDMMDPKFLPRAAGQTDGVLGVTALSVCWLLY